MALKIELKVAAGLQNWLSYLAGAQKAIWEFEILPYF
jgi:hypothetical protein